MTNEELELWIGRHAVDSEGQKVGTVADVYVDDATGQPEWLAIVTGLFGTRISFAPLAGAEENGDDISVPFSKSLIKDSPNVEADGQLSEEEEERLYRHYGKTYARTERAGDAIVNAEQAGELELQESGSTTMQAEVTADVARMRLRRREAQSVESIGLTLDDDE